MMRFNPHWHCIILEGGIDEKGSFHHIPIKDTFQLTEVFRRRVIQLFVEKGLLQKSFAMKLLGWKHSGFSVDNSVQIPASSQKARVNLSQYIIRHPVSLKKVMYIKEKGNILYHTKYNDYWKENIKLFKATDFIAELTQHIPQKHKHLIRYYGLCWAQHNTDCIPAGRRERRIKMEALRNTGTHPRLKSSLNMLSIPRWRRYRTRHHDGAGRGWYKRYMNSIRWSAHNAVMRWKWSRLLPILMKYKKYLNALNATKLHVDIDPRIV